MPVIEIAVRQTKNIRAIAIAATHTNFAEAD
jgi:hypothetical protein